MTDAAPDQASDQPPDRRRKAGRSRRRGPGPVGVVALGVLVVTVVAVALGLVTREEVQRLDRLAFDPTAAAAPFYVAPDPLPPGVPGSILRTEQLGPTPDGTPPGTTVTRVLYRSTSFTGEPIAVSGVVFTPGGTAPPGGRPVVAWAHPTTGVASACAPSLHEDGGASLTPGLADLLAAGAVVAATDYPGLGTAGPHPYLVGTSEARAVLDVVRAARSLPESGAGSRFVVWGHSQGGHAALFTGQEADSYAPELELVGVAAVAPATELAELIERDQGTLLGSILTSMAVIAWSQVFPDAPADKAIEPYALPLAEAIASRCITKTSSLLVDVPAGEIERLGLLRIDPTTTPPWSDLLAQNTPGGSPAGAPVLLLQGTADDVVAPEVTQAFATRLCKAGETVAYQTLPGVAHLGAGDAAAPIVVTWARDRFAGGPAGSSCDQLTGGG